MLAHHALNPELKHDLGFVASVYARTPYWKQEFKEKKGTILDMKASDARTYNLRDCVVLQQILPDLLSDLEEIGNTSTYYEESMGLLPSFQEMMETTLIVDPERAKLWKKDVSRRTSAQEKLIREKYNLPPEFNLKSTTHLLYFMFGVELPAFEKLQELWKFEPQKQRAYRCAKCNKKGWHVVGQPIPMCTKCSSEEHTLLDEYKEAPLRKAGTQAHSDLLSLARLREHGAPIYRNSYKVPIDRKTGNYTCDAKARLTYNVHLHQRLADIQSFKRPRPEHIQEMHNIEIMIDFIRDYNYFAELEKLRSTYGDFKVDAQNRLHYSLLIHGTATGRLSSSHENVLVFPKPKEHDDEDEEDYIDTSAFRKCFVAPTPEQAVEFGWTDTLEKWYVLSCDYSSLEGLTMAYETQDPLLIEAVEGGKLHDENTKALFGITPDHPQWKSYRDLAKIFMFAHISYDGGLSSTHKAMKVKNPNMTLTLEGLRDAASRYFDTMKTFSEWRVEKQRIATEERVSTNAFGRVRRLFGSDQDILKQALNNPNQSAAAHIMNMATIRAHRRKCELGLKSRLQIQIYDDMRWLVPESELHILIPLVVEEMERPLEMHGVTRVFPTDIELGPSWGELKHIPKEKYIHA
jgi:DNA polymerase I-like protein with 3'-5' exonuclease and polymerase domains